MLVLFLVFLGAFATPRPTVPTPYPTITPAPKSSCAYEDEDQGPFALDCLQAEYLKRGCRIFGESYPTETGLDSDEGETEVDGLVRDKAWYNQQSWGEVKTALNALATDGKEDCRGTPTDQPTPEPTAVPTSRKPTNPPTPRPTSETPAPVYSQDDEEGWRQQMAKVSAGAAVANADLATKCAPIFGRQYDATTYVVVVTVGDSVNYYTTEGEVCNLFSDDALTDGQTFQEGNRVGGPFQDVADQASRPWATTSASDEMTVEITSRRVNTACREIVTPWDIHFEISQTDTFCGDTRSTNHCSDNSEANQRQIALARANRLFTSCDSDSIFNVDTADGSGFTYDSGSDCWNSNGGTEPAYVGAMRDMLCTARCSVATEIYHADTESCWSVTAAGAAGSVSCGDQDAASINSREENNFAKDMCNGSECYLGSVDFGTAGATWADGRGVDFVYFKGHSETKAGFVADTTTQAFMNSDGRWQYNDGSDSYATLCRSDADVDATTTHRDIAETCSINPTVDGNTVDNFETLEDISFPELNQDRSGFRDADQPGVLSIGIDVPKTLYGVEISFENSTNDDAEYTDFRTDNRWAVTHEAGCDTDATYTLSVPWTVFNLGGAGGVARLIDYKNEAGEIKNSLSEENTDGSNRKFVFGSTLRVSAKQPLEVVLDERTSETVTTNEARKARWTRDVSVLIPVIVTFQKTVTVSTNTDIVSTKFNYKTVAALIQSIQYETQYFSPPYAKIKLRIRTKSQYPYMFSTHDMARHTVSVGSVSDAEANAVDTVLTHLANDANCTFTNPDHMREGDICVQEWELDITPKENVCYATGEYSIEYETACFIGKKVCYMPVDDNNKEMTSVSFTFKIQTSKFCPTVADEIELGGSLTITGRQSFKPDSHDKEGATVGDWYIQGEEIFVLGRTTSERAKIVSTDVIMVEVHQDLDGLIQTGFNRIPFDPNTKEIVVWTAPVTNENANRLANGVVTVVADGVTDDVVVMEDTKVFGSKTDFTDYEFTEEEAGFNILLHARVFPVNTDSFSTKKLVVTMQVQYEGIGTGGGRRRRLVTGDKYTDRTNSVDVGLRSWRPKTNLPSGLKGVASMSMTMSIQNGHVSRGNAAQFKQSWENAVVTGLNRNLKGKKIYSQQLSVDELWSGENKIWARSGTQAFSDDRRLLQSGAQKLRIKFTFADVPFKNSMPLFELITLFEQQLKLPASPLMSQPVFRTSVIHELEKTDSSDYRPSVMDFEAAHDVKSLDSSAMIATPFFALLSLFLAFL